MEHIFKIYSNDAYNISYEKAYSFFFYKCQTPIGVEWIKTIPTTIQELEMHFLEKQFKTLWNPSKTFPSLSFFYHQYKVLKDKRELVRDVLLYAFHHLYLKNTDFASIESNILTFYQQKKCEETCLDFLSLQYPKDIIYTIYSFL